MLIDPSKSFIELPIFRWVSGALLCVAFCITILIIVNSTLPIKLDYQGFNNLVEIFKLPLGIIAVIITFNAFLATMHRSAQTKEQIFILRQQNVFSNYYKHIEEFEKYIESVFPSNDVRFGNIRNAYNKLFPESFYGDYRISTKIINAIDSDYSKLVKELNKFNRVGEKKLSDLFYIFKNTFQSSSDALTLVGASVSFMSGRQLVVDGIKISIPDYNLRGGFAQILKNAKVLVQILSFDHRLEIPKSLVQVLEMNISVVPNLSFDVYKSPDAFDVFGKAQS